MTQTRAHRALFGFLQRAHHDGLTFVLVITGKGKMGAESERGVLRRQVPQWLGLPEFRSLVVGFEEAHIGHGGEGALYVRVRRARARAFSAKWAGSREENASNRPTIPTRGISVTIQPNTEVFRSSADIGGTSFEAGSIFTACRIRNRHTAQFEIQRE